MGIIQSNSWFVGDMSPQHAESLLYQNNQAGCFVVRNSKTKGLYSLSLHTGICVKHYHIKQSLTKRKGYYYLFDGNYHQTVPHLIHYHMQHAGGLPCRLKSTLSTSPDNIGINLGNQEISNWEIHASELEILEKLGSGAFGVVHRGRWRKSTIVAVKTINPGAMSEDELRKEAKIMTKLQHPNVVQLYGVCFTQRPIKIVIEFMKHGSLLSYLSRYKQSFLESTRLLLDMCIQVCKGMYYLESNNFIHRDLAARNCLVGSANTIKVADFGLARFVLDNEYRSSRGSLFPIRWSPPEVIRSAVFSSKSDVWSFGVLMFEIFTCGKVPYEGYNNSQVMANVQRGKILEKPMACSKEIYDIMKQCWSYNPEDRPGFGKLLEKL
ncbi:tyrosine-protein kinase Btk-like [Culicoides brevitarsis]|uniref:tyrosine-protein kinase Btk-like n=1 Tax=Culicoides brevitarsis TaxID=469753 RepID=UPI00307B738D